MTKSDCIFCKIANGEIPAAALYEDEDFCVILDANPGTRGHALILPKEHFEDLCELDAVVGAKVLPLATKLGKAMKPAFGCNGFNLVQNNGKAAGQTVNHFHMHIIPRYNGGPDIVSWKPGSISAEEMGMLVEAVKAQL